MATAKFSALAEAHSFVLLGRMNLVVGRGLRHRLLTPDRSQGHSRLE